MPISAPEGYGGVGVPLVPKVSLTHHVAWLQYLSQQDLVSLVVGMGLSVSTPSQGSHLDRACRGWLQSLIKDNAELCAAGVSPILHPCPISDEGMIRISISDAYRSALGRVRSAEFYFRAPFENDFTHAPSVRAAARKFNQKVVNRVPTTYVAGYGATKLDLERKTSVYFARSGGFLPDPGSDPLPSFYGLERSGEVRLRYKAPHLLRVG